MHTQQSPYEIGADGSDEGGTSHCIVLFCERYWLSGVGGRGCGRRVASRGKDLVSAQSERFPSVRICRFLARSWQSPYEIGADGSDEGGTSHVI